MRFRAAGHAAQDDVVDRERQKIGQDGDQQQVERHHVALGKMQRHQLKPFGLIRRALDQPLHVVVPAPLPALDREARLGPSVADLVEQAQQVDAFVVAVLIQRALALQSDSRDHQRLEREFAYTDAAGARLQAEFVRGIGEFQALARSSSA